MSVRLRFKFSYCFLLIFFLFNSAFSQPFVDIVNTSYQSLNTTYKDSLKSKNTTTNYFLNVTLPIQVDSQNTIIVRLYGEQLQSNIKNDSYNQTNNLYSTLMPIGLQHETKNKKWKVLGLAMPKLSSDFKNKISSYDMQLGGYGLVTYTKSEKLKFKLGLFYNREFFNNFFFIPLAGIDWRVS